MSDTAFIFTGISFEELTPPADSVAAFVKTERGVGVQIFGVTFTRGAKSNKVKLYPKTGTKLASKGKGGRKQVLAHAESDQQEAEGQAFFYLVCFDGRLSQSEMMAMYYYSTGEVGATGD